MVNSAVDFVTNLRLRFESDVHSTATFGPKTFDLNIVLVTAVVVGSGALLGIWGFRSVGSNLRGVILERRTDVAVRVDARVSVSAHHHIVLGATYVGLQATSERLAAHRANEPGAKAIGVPRSLDREKNAVCSVASHRSVNLLPNVKDEPRRGLARGVRQHDS